MKFKKSITEYWMMNYVAYFADNAACSLCGNSGVIHSEGVRTAAGALVGRANYCICPNGQAMREQSGNLTPRAVDCAYCHCLTAVIHDDVCINCAKPYKSHSH